MRNTLTEHQHLILAKVTYRNIDDGKSLYMEGIFVQGEKRNRTGEYTHRDCKSCKEYSATHPQWCIETR